VYAVVKGSAVAQDGKSASLTAPNGLAQVDLLRTALRDAEVQPNDVSFIEAHGTGTKLGDPVETGALATVFGQGRTDALYVSSVKANIGHLEAAAGMAGLLSAVLALYHGEAPPNAQLHKLNQKITETIRDSPMMFPTVSTKIPQVPGRSLIAGVSSFGYSGTIAHAVLEEAPAMNRRKLGDFARYIPIAPTHR
jgi:acyl transferase domain-containing protein